MPLNPPSQLPATAHVELDWEQVCTRHLPTLYRHAEHCCRRSGLDPALAPDVTHDALRRCVGRVIRGTSDIDALRFVRRAISNGVIDRCRRHSHARRHRGSTCPQDSSEDLLDQLRFAQGQAGAVSDLDARRLLRAALAAPEHLHLHVPRNQDAVRGMIQVTWQLRVEGWSLRELVRQRPEDGSEEKQRERLKKWAQRGLWMLEGWLHALTGHGQRPAPDSGRRRTYWDRGHDAGFRYLESADPEDNDGRK